MWMEVDRFDKNVTGANQNSKFRTKARTKNLKENRSKKVAWWRLKKPTTKREEGSSTPTNEGFRVSKHPDEEGLVSKGPVVAEEVAALEGINDIVRASVKQLVCSTGPLERSLLKKVQEPQPRQRQQPLKKVAMDKASLRSLPCQWQIRRGVEQRRNYQLQQVIPVLRPFGASIWFCLKESGGTCSHFGDWHDLLWDESFCIWKM